MIDNQGLIVTNQHVVHRASYISVKLEHNKVYQAQLLEVDIDHDLAIIRVNPLVVSTLKPLAIKDSDLSEGETIVAIGYPLNYDKVMTSGLVSRVKPEYIASDININPGNSGGPVVDSSGSVIGVATFTTQASSGPGLSGIVPAKYIPSLVKACDLKVYGNDSITKRKLPLNPPPADSMRDVPDTTIPLSVIQDCANKDLKPFVLKNPKDCLTTIYTPFTVASGSTRLNREIDSRRSKRGIGESLSDPIRSYDVHDYVPVVTISVEPLLRQADPTGEQILLGFLTGIANRDFKFEVEFKDMQLFRDKELVAPVRRMKFPIGGLATSNSEVFDIGYAGIHQYLPEDFKPGARLKLKVKRSIDGEGWIEFNIPDKMQKQIYDSFQYAVGHI